jgi:hypothetical protein
MDNIASGKAAIVSITSAAVGQVYAWFPMININEANTLFQHLAWTVAILAGIVSIVNGVRKWFVKEKKKETE